MIDRSKETLITLQEAAAALPAVNGRPIHWRTLYSWWWKGKRGIRLETVEIANRRFTSREALDRFIEATNAAREPQRAEPIAPPVATKVSAATKAALARHGIHF